MINLDILNRFMYLPVLARCLSLLADKAVYGYVVYFFLRPEMVKHPSHFIAQTSLVTFSYLVIALTVNFIKKIILSHTHNSTINCLNHTFALVS